MYMHIYIYIYTYKHTYICISGCCYFSARLSWKFRGDLRRLSFPLVKLPKCVAADNEKNESEYKSEKTIQRRQ